MSSWRSKEPLYNHTIWWWWTSCSLFFVEQLDQFLNDLTNLYVAAFTSEMKHDCFPGLLFHKLQAWVQRWWNLSKPLAHLDLTKPPKNKNHDPEIIHKNHRGRGIYARASTKKSPFKQQLMFQNVQLWFKRQMY